MSISRYQDDDEEYDDNADYEKDNRKVDINSRIVEIKELDPSSLYPLHPNDMKNGSKYVIIGKPGTGKSTLVKSIIYAKKHIFPVGMFFSGTEDSNGFFSEIAPSSFIYNGLDTNNLTPIENFKKRQKYSKQYLESRGEYPWALNVIDDCTYDTKFLKKPIFQELYKNGRHWRMMHILSLQYCLDIKPEIRTCIDGVFILRESSLNMRKKLFENYGSCVESLNDWNDIMDQLTDNFTAIFINNKTISNSMEDNIFYYKADPNKVPKDWKFGCREYWDFHYERFDQSFIEGG